jgi:Spy/CpxP family protein refolding chaperone
MNPRRAILSVVCIVATLGAATTVSAANPPATTNGAPIRQGWHDGAGGPGGGLHRILDQLSVTPEQTTQIQAIFAQARPRLQAVHESGRANREQLEVTPPTDPGYAGMVAAAKSNAAEQIQLMSDLWTQVYAKLTPAQRAQIPGIVAAQRAERTSQRPSQPTPSSGR